MTPRHLPEEDPRSKVALAWGQQSIYIYKEEIQIKEAWKGKKRYRMARHTTILVRVRGSLIGGWVGCFFWGEHRIVPFMGSSMDT